MKFKWVAKCAISAGRSSIPDCLSISESHRVRVAVLVLVLPNALLLIIDIVADFGFAVGAFDQGRTIEAAELRGELREVAALDGVGLDEPLLSAFFALLKCAQLHYFQLLVDQNAEAVRLELLVDVEVLAPEYLALVRASLDLIKFSEF